MPVLYVTGCRKIQFTKIVRRLQLTFRHRASCILGQAFRYSPEKAFYIFNQQTYVAGGRWPATSWVHYITNCNTQSSAPEDG